MNDAHPEDLSADVGRPLLFQRVALGVLDQIRHRAGAAELHDQLRRITRWTPVMLFMTE